MLTVSVPVVPFYEAPRREWVAGAEKKARVSLPASDSDSEGPPSARGALAIEEWASDSGSESDDPDSAEALRAHIAKLMGGEQREGEAPPAKIDTSFLEDLRVVKKRRNLLYYFSWIFVKFVEIRANERLRRKHHILKEYEAKVKKYYENQQRTIERNLRKQEMAVIMEAYRTEQRIARNSKKIADKDKMADEFTKDLIQRDKEKIQMEFRVANLSKWTIEGTDRREIEGQDRRAAADALALRRAKELEADNTRQSIEADAALLEDDKVVTKEVQTLMLKYGMISYEDKPIDSTDNRLDFIIQSGNAKGMAQRQRDKENAMIAAALAPPRFEEDSKFMRLTIRHDADVDKILKGHRKSHRYGGKKRDQEYLTPFAEDLSATGSIMQLKAINIGEVGALSLAAEFSRGACPMLEQLNLKGCSVRSEGAGWVFKGIKMANLLSLRVLNLRGNFLGPETIAYLKEACLSGVFMNLQVLVLNDNEIGDDGVKFLLEIIMDGHFQNISEIHLQRNGISDYGFVTLVKKMKSVQQVKCPQLERLALENNLVSVEVKRTHRPYPAYMSI